MKKPLPVTKEVQDAIWQFFYKADIIPRILEKRKKEATQ